jgi:hypothetical protein
VIPPGVYRTSRAQINRPGREAGVAVGRPAASEKKYNPYLGWVVGGILILAIFAVMGVFWFMYHPL